MYRPAAPAPTTNTSNFSVIYQREEGRRKKEEGRRKKEGGRRKKEEGRRKKEEGRRKKEEGRRPFDFAQGTLQKEGIKSII